MNCIPCFKVSKRLVTNMNLWGLVIWWVTLLRALYCTVARLGSFQYRWFCMLLVLRIKHTLNYCQPFSKSYCGWFCGFSSFQTQFAKTLKLRGKGNPSQWTFCRLCVFSVFMLGFLTEFMTMWQLTTGTDLKSVLVGILSTPLQTTAKWELTVDQQPFLRYVYIHLSKHIEEQVLWLMYNTL